jgi:hypothetical protein
MAMPVESFRPRAHCRIRASAIAALQSEQRLRVAGARLGLRRTSSARSGGGLELSARDRDTPEG